MPTNCILVDVTTEKCTLCIKDYYLKTSETNEVTCEEASPKILFCL